MSYNHIGMGLIIAGETVNHRWGNWLSLAASTSGGNCLPILSGDCHLRYTLWLYKGPLIRLKLAFSSSFFFCEISVFVFTLDILSKLGHTPKPKALNYETKL